MALIAIFALPLLSSTHFSRSAFTHPQQAKQKVFVYAWFNDQDMTDPTGTISDTYTELTRLRSLYSGYVFSSSPGIGLAPFEYGYQDYSPTVLIYSNF